MDYQKIIQQIKKGDSIEVETSQASTYEKAKVQIKKVQIVDTAKSAIQHYLVDKAIESNEHTALIAFDLDVKFTDNTKISTQQVSYLLTKKGEIAYYSGFEMNGKYTPETLLHEITRRCAEYSEIQKEKFQFNPFVFNIKVYEGLIFEINAKKITLKAGGEAVILETDYQRVKDEENKKNYQSSKEVDAVDNEIEVNNDELPF